MTNPLEPIRGKVARVLNSREVALNKGSNDGVTIGMIFKILSPAGSAIRDPDTGDMLGSVELTKTRVKITVVQDRVSVAATYHTYRINVGGSGSALLFDRLFEPPKWETRIETLKIDEAALEELDEEDAYVKTGDPVVQDLEVGLTDETGQDPESSQVRES